MSTFTRTATVALAATALGLLLSAAPARAADGDQYDDQTYDDQYTDQQYSDNDADQVANNEEIQVIAPRFHREPGTRVGGPPGKLSLSRNVAYDDLDLTTRRGTHELRERIRAAADDVCSTLAAVYYPGTPEKGHDCYTEAVQNGMLRANRAISAAREEARNY